MAYSSSSNNYAESDVRLWLNNTFYETAFTSYQRDLIRFTEIDNSMASTGITSNKYACSNTYDKIFLLSYKEATQIYLSSNYDRRMSVRDFAIALGASKSGTESYGYWWLRSPYSYTACVRVVYSDGGAEGYIESTTNWLGVVPAMWITL